jgi:hypothetical protein
MIAGMAIENVYIDEFANDYIDQNYTDFVDRLRQALDGENGALWAQGDLIYEQVQERFPGVARSKERSDFFDKVAADVNRSPSLIRRRYRTSKIFDERYADHTWTMHCVAAHSKRPHYWMDRAVANNWSQAELEAHIKASKEGKTTSLTIAKAAKMSYRRLKHGWIMLQVGELDIPTTGEIFGTLVLRTDDE